MEQGNPTPYELIGEGQLHKLIDTFYSKVKNHSDLQKIFPDDLSETARKQKQFMTQFLGGPPLYTEEHGHPMLRARHIPFEITEQRASAWLACMEEAMDEVGLQGELREYFYRRLYMTAHHMVNTASETGKGEDS
ncbi:globin domain-containing protein [Bacillus massiliglaciei]|uniref:globin domain-containing protein n=1 Tax=Bacillus massiliglaciei TaxID=1816693 RepID=UPI000A645F99|nr:globin [Bacillus massiliglaciei]